MKLVHTILLVLHVAGGMTALVSGLIPMFARKGSKLHKAGGRWYTWAMWMSVLSALPLSMMKQNLFLGTIAIFTMYMIYSGNRTSKRKSVVPTGTIDLMMMGMALLAGTIMVSYGGWLLLGQSEKTGMGIILLVFGTITFLLGFEDLGYWEKKGPGVAEKLDAGSSEPIWWGLYRDNHGFSGHQHQFYPRAASLAGSHCNRRNGHGKKFEVLEAKTQQAECLILRALLSSIIEKFKKSGSSTEIQS